MEASRRLQSPTRDFENTREPRVPRRFIRQAMARCSVAGGLTAVSVSCLDAMRWHIRLTPTNQDSRKEIYISPEDGGLFYVTTAGGNMHITLYSDLGEDCVRNLGDCLVKALCDEARRIDIWLGASTRIAAAAGGMFESLGRTLGEKDRRTDVTIHGPDQAARMLTRAFARGASRANKRGGPS